MKKANALLCTAPLLCYNGNIVTDIHGGVCGVLDELRDKVMNCDKCRLAATRTNAVFGVGPPGARVVFVGEGPGEQEDLKGEPFVGRAGALLDKMLAATGFSRGENIYIANMVKCRPPGNRDPQPDEVDACIGYLRQQIHIINPLFIVCLGRVAAKALIDPDFRVTVQHGQFVQKDSVWMMGTFHPAALLRNPNQKPDAFDDFCKLRDRLAELLKEEKKQ